MRREREREAVRERESEKMSRSFIQSNRNTVKR